MEKNENKNRFHQKKFEKMIIMVKIKTPIQLFIDGKILKA